MYEFKVTFSRPGKLDDWTLIVAHHYVAAPAAFRAAGYDSTHIIKAINLLGAVGPLARYSEPHPDGSITVYGDDDAVVDTIEATEIAGGAQS